MLRGAVVGLGAIGSHHARIAAASPRIDLVGAADPRGDRLGALADRDAVFGSVDQLLAERELDVAVVAVPATEHAAVAVALARAGVHLLVEKPLAPTAAAARAIMDACSASGVLGAVGHHERASAPLARLRTMVAGGAIGPLRSIATHRRGSGPAGQPDVGVVLDLLTHDLDLTRWIAGRPLEGLRATAHVNGSAPLEDHAVITGHLPRGATFRCEAAWSGGAKIRRIDISGADGRLTVDSLTLTLTRTYTDGRPPSVARFEHPRELFAVQLDAFCDYVEGRVPAPLAGLEDGHAAVVAAECALLGRRDAEPVCRS